MKKRIYPAFAVIAILLTVIFTACGDNGSTKKPAPVFNVFIIETGGGQVTATPNKGKENTLITLNIVFNAEELALASLSVIDADGNDIEYNAAARTFKMPKSNVYVTASFIEKKDPHPITVNEAEHGEILSSHTEAQEGIEITITLNEQLGYFYEEETLVIRKESGGTVQTTPKGSSGLVFTFWMPDEAVTVEAVFVRDDALQFTIDRDTPEDGGRFVGLPTKSEWEDTVTLELEIDYGYRYTTDSILVYKTADAGKTPLELTAVTGQELTWTFAMPMEPVTVVADWTKIPVFTITVDNSAIDDPDGSLTVDKDTAFGEETITITLDIDEILYLYMDDLSIMIDGSDKILDATKDSGSLEWTYTLPPEPAEDTEVSISATVTARPAYVISTDTTQMISGEFDISPSDRVLGGTEITITIININKTHYEFQNDLKILVDNVDKFSEAVPVSGEDLSWTYTLPPEPVDDVPVVISGSVDFIPAYDIILPVVGTGGSIAASPLVAGTTTARRGWTVMITITLSNVEDYRLKNDLFSATAAVAGDLSPVRDGAFLRWTFTMPDEDVTVAAEVEPIPGVTLTVTPNPDASYAMSNVLSSLGSNQYDVREGRTVTITVTPKPGFKAVSPTGSVVFTPAGENAWSFAMPTTPTTIGVSVESLLEIYKGGARNGISVADVTVNGIGTTSFYQFYDAVELNSNDPGHNGNLHSLKISAVPNDAGTAGRDNSFMLVSSDAIDLSDVVALSFWAKTGSGNFSGAYAGFGTNGTDQMARIVYNGPANAQGSALPFTATWQRFIIPKPLAEMTVTNPLMLRVTIPLGNTLYLDDIEFIRSGVSLKEINVRTGSGPFQNSNPTYVIPDIPADLPFDATAIILNRGFMLRYELEDDNSSWYLHSEPQGNNWKYNLREMIMPQLTYALSGSGNNGVISPTGTITPDGTLGGSLSFAVSMNGITSNVIALNLLMGPLRDVTIPATSGGTITVSPTLVGGQMPAGTLVTVTAQALTNYSYTTGSINVYRTAGGTSATVTLTPVTATQWTFEMPDEAVTITANFAMTATEYTINFDDLTITGGLNEAGNRAAGWWLHLLQNGGTSTGFVSNNGQSRSTPRSLSIMANDTNAEAGLAGQYFEDAVDMSSFTEVSFWIRYNNAGGSNDNVELEFLLNNGGTYPVAQGTPNSMTGTFYAANIKTIGGAAAGGSTYVNGTKFRVPLANNVNTAWLEIVIDLADYKSQPGFNAAAVKGWAFRMPDKSQAAGTYPRFLVDDIVFK
ncbi:MAG: hypothetical protein FWH41_05445 [Treponema sp.]|nr:hypothetical protein [Treponema sp.]